ncbi:MAG: hypothetical protein V1792_18520 [Pseudomonadota bacterium]
MPIQINARMRMVLDLASRLAEDSYVVGGAVRDALMGRKSDADLDLAVRGDGFSIAKDLADFLGPEASFVPLDRDRGTGRVVLKGDDGGSVDISSFKGPDIFEDLRRRDFTINAVAVKISDMLQSGPAVLVDPLGGVADIEAKLVRICSGEAFPDDPLRILRAFRFSSSLGLVITPETSAAVRESVGLIVNVAPERIRDEFIAVLACGSSIAALREMDRCGVLDVIFPELRPMKGCGQNAYHHLDVWSHTLEAVERFEWITSRPHELFGVTEEIVASYLTEEAVTGRPRSALLKLVILFHDSGKPAVRSVDAGGKVRFFGHEQVSRSIFLDACGRMKLARREMEIAAGLIEGHMRAMILTGDSVSKRAIHRLWRRFGNDLAGLLLIFLADLTAARGPARPVGEDERAFQRVRHVLEWFVDLQTCRPPLVNGHDLMGVLGLAPGPYLGWLLEHLAELRDNGEITTKEEALSIAAALIRNNHPF